jgi:MscS family membrane protein
MTHATRCVRRRRGALASALALVAFAVVVLGKVPLEAQEPPADSAATAAAPATPDGSGDDIASPRSPRASLQAFLNLTAAGRYDSAARFLAWSEAAPPDSALHARRLRAVLDRRVRFDLGRVSGDAPGDTADGLAPGVDRIATIVSREGDSTDVRMVRSAADALDRSPAWRFGPSTVATIPAWYGALEGRWALEYLPAPLLRAGPGGILWWQWIALVVLLVFAIGVGKLAGRVVRGVLGRLVGRTAATWDDAILERLTGPVSVAGALLTISAVLPALGMVATAEARLYQGIRGALFIDFFWALWRLVDVAADLLISSPWASATASSRSLIPLGARVAKVGVAAVAAVATLSLLGYPVASLIAGLGLGGLAFALAAQKTVENLFGAFSLGVDQPFREGDFVKIEEFVGTVEAIGLRSTRFRTLDRTLISIPNGRLAEMRIESYTARDRLRLATVIGLVYETSAAQMREVLAGFERVLRAHPRIWPDTVTVRFREFAASSLDIEVMAWFTTSNWGEFQAIRQEILLDFMGVVEAAGSSFAFPTQTLHLVRAGRDDANHARAPGEHAR